MHTISAITPQWGSDFVPLGASQGFDPLQGSTDWIAILLGARVVLQCVMAWYVFAAASRLAVRGAGPALFPPWMWGVMALFGGWLSLVTVPLFFALMHYTTWSAPDTDVEWSGGGSPAPRSGLRREQADRLRDAQDELRAAKEARRVALFGAGDSAASPGESEST